jgi:hypothetical protein
MTLRRLASVGDIRGVRFAMLYGPTLVAVLVGSLSYPGWAILHQARVRQKSYRPESTS